MINKLKEKFSNIVQNECLEYATDNEFFIYDCDDRNENCSKGRCYISFNDGQFKILNKDNKDIGFIAVDKCIFFDDDRHKKADCILFDEDTICFIEIKDCKSKQRSKRKKDAIKQLQSTLKIFKEKVEFDKNIEAHLCIGYSHTTPSTLASNIAAKVEFEEDFDATLFEGCQKEFNKIISKESLAK